MTAGITIGMIVSMAVGKGMTAGITIGMIVAWLSMW